MLPSDNNRKIQNIVQIGKIKAVDLSRAPGLVRVEIDSGVLTDWMPVAMPFIGNTWIWCAPKIGVSGTVVNEGGEDNVCRFHPNYFDESNYPYLSEADFKIHFKNGDAIHHNAESGALIINSTSSITVNTKKATVNADQSVINSILHTVNASQINLNGNVKVAGSFTQVAGMSRSGNYTATFTSHVNFLTEFTVMGTTWSTHAHKGVQPGGGKTGGVS